MGTMEDFIKGKSGGIGDADISWVLRNAKWILRKAHGPLARFARHLRLFVSMLRDWRSGKYRELPAWTIGVVAFALLYILMPFDAVPDFIPLVGLADDALVVAAALSMVGHDLKDYRRWLVRERWRTRAGRRQQDEPRE